MHSIPPRELLPPLPPSFFGRDELIDEIVSLAENLKSLALIGPGGIGKTSIALTVLHHDRIKKRFGDNRWFIRCDQFPASKTHFLNRLSKVIGTGVENPDSLAFLEPLISSREMILFLDNAESILDPEGANGQEIYTLVEELSRFSSVCLCLTSRIIDTPVACEPLKIPTLSMEAAHNTFYSIYKNNGQSDLINVVLEQLDFHPLSITLLATVARSNDWDINRLVREWETKRTDMLHTKRNENLATTIELSLASPMFQGLGPYARDLLGVIAFFPQGVDENNLDWLFPTVSNRADIFDSFCILSLTYRNNGFFTMLAPLRDYLCPKDPASSVHLNAVRGRYFSRLLVGVKPGHSSFKETQWIVSEDLNVEHLLDVFTSVDMGLSKVWNVCACFMEHLRWHKPRLVVLGPRFEGIPDYHPSKPECLFQLSQLFNFVRNHVEEKQHLLHSLRLWREQGNDRQVAQTLRFLANANRLLHFNKEGIQHVKEALEMYKQLNNILGQAYSWQELGQMLYDDKQLDAAEEATSQAMTLILGERDQYLVCRCQCTLGDIYHSKGQVEKAINHFETALGIASSSNWGDDQFWIYYSLAQVFFDQGRFHDADVQVEHAKSHVINTPYFLGRAMELQAGFWHNQHRLEEAKSEVLHAINIYEKIGVIKDLEDCRVILQNIEEAMDKQVTSCK